MNKLPEPIQSDPAISFDSDSQCNILLFLWYQWESHVVIILQRFTKEKQSTMNSSDTLNMYVLNWINKSSSDVGSSMFDCSKLKIGCSSLITYRWTCSSSFDVRKSDVRVSSKSDLVSLVKALLGLKFDVRSFEAKNGVFEFDYHRMNMFMFDRCSKKWCSSQFNE